MSNKPDEHIPRIIGEYTSNKKGPLLFVTAGIHGNEPSGVKALEEVFKQLEKTKPEIEGTLVGVSGNHKALNQNKRYIDEDLNRVWTEENIEQEKDESHEQKEMWEIIEILNKFPEKDFTKRYFLDCHTTSSASLPYVSVQEVNDNDKWAHNFPTFIVRGFSDIITGDIDHYLSRIGMTGFVFEAGQHEDKTSVENHEGVIWLALKEACNLDLSKIKTYPECVNRFAEKNAPEQKTFELVHRHGLKDSDTFEMEPGYENFQEIEKGELLAKQNGKELKSEWDARIFMPLYQSQGNDGFFVIEEAEVK
ncbi:succinylglutamate desuccinylase/aspartoacylase family protein [Salegentibacter mishustinae]|jgi:succinylglutamate desuccinylase|uniref:succinylglutamate desuccinylase/aspartoacylase domain-containing protein n=1 Tax=Salegentibacter mishustinae TaxID=270918 RepID=UPI001CE0C295|nr:succinylglutamate desuccinylase/aspartoacylase family protein [Salegentibacter mishustinae]UBZ06618.1 succinylglutamate desuccinylase/aspartoacylase family protein [Salegentibacter mishustinae]